MCEHRALLAFGRHLLREFFANSGARCQLKVSGR